MKRYEGELEYDEYKDIQIERSNSKWHSTTFDEYLFFKIIMSCIPKMTVTGIKKLNPKKVLCVGIRDGNEYFAFNKLKLISNLYAGSEIYGVDINPKVVGVGENCFEADFNHLPAEWGGNFDLLYSNSLDHSYNVERTVLEWRRVLQNNRFIILTLSTADVSSTDLYSFESGDSKKLFYGHNFSVINVWQEYRQEGSYNVLLKIKK